MYISLNNNLYSNDGIPYYQYYGNIFLVIVLAVKMCIVLITIEIQ